jgi:hypothetical protein
MFIKKQFQPCSNYHTTKKGLKKKDKEDRFGQIEQVFTENKKNPPTIVNSYHFSFEEN